MSSDRLFELANMVALVGWVGLLASPLLPRLSQIIAGLVVPALLGTLYAGLALAFWSSTKGGFGSLEQVAALFETRELLLAGWVHYLAFDLMVGAWEVRRARAEGIAFVLVVPCLVLTFLFGPAGLVLFLCLRFALRLSRGRPLTAHLEPSHV